MTAVTEGPAAGAAQAPRSRPSAATATRKQAEVPGLPPAGLAAIWIVLALFVAVPFALVFAVSFGQNVDGAAWHWALTFENYKRFFVGLDWPASFNDLYLEKLWNSFRYAALGSLFAVLLAFPFVYTLTRRSRRTQTVWLAMILAALSLSEVFVVMGWDILLSNRSGLPMVLRETGVTQFLKDIGAFPTLREWGLANPRDLRFKPSDVATILGLTYLVWPYAVILLYPPLSRLDQSMVEAARTMGAKPATVVRTVVIPAIRLPLIGSVLLLFVYLLGVLVVVSVFSAPADQTLTVTVADAVRGAALNAPFGAAQSVVLLVVAGVFLATSLWLTKRAEAAR
ncbi:MAG: ABC transporter permease subunit [Pseudomonadota bacterium]